MGKDNGTGQRCQLYSSGDTFDVPRHGFKCYGKTFRMAWFRPNTTMNPEAAENYAADFSSFLDHMLDELFIARMEGNEAIFSRV